MAKEIEIRIKKNGEMKIETFGTEGVECESLINKVVNYVGGKVADGDKKPEYWDHGRNVYTNVG